ncbi:MAG: hypothetical protein CMJ58_18475 [Planctomycetaceae bacterium]|nr:hypothetical protein [Planctomycetaceae bacterium]
MLILTTLLETTPVATLTAQGWAMMLVSIGVVLSLVSYCLYRVLNLPPVDVQDIKGPLEIDTGDTTDAD